MLYRLPEVRTAVLAGETIHVCEGEKKSELLVALGLCATTNDGGAGKWLPEHAAALHDAQSVVVWADNDEPGRTHALAVARALHAVGVPEIRLVIPPVEEGQGLDDWLAARSRTRSDVEGLRTQCPLWEPNTTSDDLSLGEATMPSGPFVKLYRSLWDGTLGHERFAREAFIFMLAHCDADGVIAMTPEAIAGRCHMPLEDVQQGIGVLETPDHRSRSQEHGGRRIIRLNEPRDWGWRIVNYRKYRDSTSAQRQALYRARNRSEVRDRNRERMRRVRARA